MLSNKRKTLAFFFLWIVVLGSVWFTAPTLFKGGLRAWKVATHLYVPLSLSSEALRSHSREIKSLKNKIFEKKQRGAKDIAEESIALGIQYEEIGSLGQAYHEFAVARALRPTSSSALSHIAGIYESMTLYAEADIAWRQAIENDPTNPELYTRFASLLEDRLSDLQRANGAYIEGLVRTSSAIGLMLSYADFLERIGEPTTARLYWQAVTEKDPTNEGVKQHLKQLELQKNGS